MMLQDQFPIVGHHAHSLFGFSAPDPFVPSPSFYPQKEGEVLSCQRPWPSLPRSHGWTVMSACTERKPVIILHRARARLPSSKQGPTTVRSPTQPQVRFHGERHCVGSLGFSFLLVLEILTALYPPLPLQSLLVSITANTETRRTFCCIRNKFGLVLFLHLPLVSGQLTGSELECECLVPNSTYRISRDAK